MDRPNTFGDTTFPDWVPQNIRDQIIDFWGQMGRTRKEWLENMFHNCSPVCYHGPGPNGFKNPPYGAKCFYFIREHRKETYECKEGRYIHAWNNMGRLIHNDGTYTVVSSCDMWVRIWESEEEKNQYLNYQSEK